MGKLKPIGSEKLEGFNKIHRMIEISNYNLNKPQPINEDKSLEFQKTLADGITYHIVKEKNGYVIKKGGLNESTSEYIEPMKNRKYYSSYSQAMKRLNLIVKEVNTNEGYSNNLSLFNESDEVKYFLKRPNNEQAQPGQQQTPTPQPVQQPAPPQATTPAPAPEGGEDMNFDDMPTDDDSMDVEPTDEPQEQDGETVTYKTIQKLVGKLGQKTREFLSNEENQLDTKQVKYIINSILSALPLESLEDEDKEEIMGKFEGGEDVEGDMNFDDMEGGDDFDVEGGDDMGEFPPMDTPEQQPAPQPTTQPAPKTPSSQEMKEVIENIFNESKVDKVLGKYFKTSSSKNEKVSKLSESYKQELTTLNILNEHPNTKLIGKNEYGEILLLNGKRLLTINRNGKVK